MSWIMETIRILGRTCFDHLSQQSRRRSLLVCETFSSDNNFFFFFQPISFSFLLNAERAAHAALENRLLCELIVIWYLDEWFSGASVMNAADCWDNLGDWIIQVPKCVDSIVARGKTKRFFSRGVCELKIKTISLKWWTKNKIRWILQKQGRPVESSSDLFYSKPK